MPILGWVVNKLRRQHYVLLFYDIYPEVVIRLAGVSNNPIITRFWRLLNRLAVQHAECTTAISPKMLKELAQNSQNNDPAKLKTIPTWVDTEQIRPIPKEHNIFARKYGQVNKLTILYSGNIGNVHDLSILPHVAEQLKDYRDIHFVIISNSPRRKSLELQASQKRLDNMTFLPLQNENIFPFSLACSDIGIVALASGAEEISMPSKIYFSMAAGSALLGFSSSTSDLASLIHNYDCRTNITPGDLNGAAQFILRMRNHPEVLKKYRDNSKQTAVQHFSKAVCVPKILEVLKEAIRFSQLFSRIYVSQLE
jgi:glycosyltransferase involved in cell wall biosynthesis